MKVAMLNTMYPPHAFGGAERVVELLSEGLVAKGRDIVVVGAAPARNHRDHVRNGVRVREIGLRNIYWPYGPSGAPKTLEPLWHVIDLRNPLMARQAARVLAEERPDVVHTHGLVGFSTLVWKHISQLGVPIIHTLHDHRLHCVRAVMYRAGRPCERHCLTCSMTTPLKRRFAPRVDTVVGVSRSVLDAHLAEGFFTHARHQVIPVPIERPANGVRPTREGPLRFGYLGRLDPMKGIEALLDASLGLPSDGWTLTIAGEGEHAYVETLHSRPRHPAVTFAGRVMRDAFLADVDTLVVPSLGLEAAGLVIAEGFAHGVPAIGVRRGGIAELITEGETGLLCDPTTDAIREALLRAIADPDALRAMAEACRRAAENHDVNRVVDAYAHEYDVARTAGSVSS